MSAPPAPLDFSNKLSTRARTPTGVAPPPAANSPPLRSSATGLPGSNQPAKVGVPLALDDRLREQRDRPEPSDHHAKTSSERIKQPSQAVESLSLMSFWIVVALRSAWSARRRPYLGAKHELLLPKERRSREEHKGPSVGVVRTTGRPLSRRQSGGGDPSDGQ